MLEAILIISGTFLASYGLGQLRWGGFEFLSGLLILVGIYLIGYFLVGASHWGGVTLLGLFFVWPTVSGLLLIRKARLPQSPPPLEFDGPWSLPRTEALSPVQEVAEENDFVLLEACTSSAKEQDMTYQVVIWQQQGTGRYMLLELEKHGALHFQQFSCLTHYSPVTVIRTSLFPEIYPVAPLRVEATSSSAEPFRSIEAVFEHHQAVEAQQEAKEGKVKAPVPQDLELLREYLDERWSHRIKCLYEKGLLSKAGQGGYRYSWSASRKLQKRLVQPQDSEE